MMLKTEVSPYPDHHGHMMSVEYDPLTHIVDWFCSEIDGKWVCWGYILRRHNLEIAEECF